MKKSNSSRPIILFIWISLINADNTWISPSDTNIVNGLSPLNWVKKPDYICSSIGGASLKVSFTGTRTVTLQVDPSNITTTEASRYPVISWSVDDGEFQSHQLIKSQTSVELASDIPDPEIDLYLKGFSPFENRYKGDVPVNAVKITGFEIDSGGRTAAVALPSKIWMNIGNSIESGDAALDKQGQSRPPKSRWANSNDGRASYGYLLANHFNYRESRLATGGYNWNGGIAGMPPLATLLDNITSTVSRLTGNVYHPAPDVVLINLGQNGAPGKKDVTDALTKLRSRVNTATKLIVMVPVSGKGRAAITSAFNSYKSSSGDNEAVLVDLGKISFASVDGIHPTQKGHEKIFTEALPHFEKIIPKPTAVTAPTARFHHGFETPKRFDIKGRVIKQLSTTTKNPYIPVLQEP